MSKSSSHSIVAVNDTLKDVSGSYRVYNIDTEEANSEGEFSICKNGIATLGHVKMMHSGKEFLVIKWTIENKKFYNHYLCGSPAIDFETYKGWNEKFKK